MLKPRCLTLTLVLVFAMAAPRLQVSATKGHRHSSNYAPGEVRVKLKGEAPQLRATNDNERLMSIANMAGGSDPAGARSAERLVNPASNERLSRIISERGLDRIYVLKVDPAADIESIVNELRTRDEVEYAEPNYLVTPGTVVPNDQRFWEQWALWNTLFFVDSYPSTADADIKAYQAWDITLGNSDVIVALTDTGIDVTHPDLAGNI